MNHNDNNSDRETRQPGFAERNVNRIIGLLVIACAATLVAEFLFRPFFDEHHPAHFAIENVFGYQAVLGFAAFVTVVFLGKFLRIFVRRPEDYYDQ